jgi:RNA polymerase sigma-70 factor (ECF subfamily)
MIGDEDQHIQSGRSDPLGNALSEAMEANKEALVRFLAARTHDVILAEDLLQDARMKLIEKGGYSDVAEPLPYIYTMLENMVRDHRRSEHARIRRNQDWGDRGDGIAPVRADPTTPERNVLDRDFLKHVLAALDTLPERTKTIFLAYRVEGESQKNIAASEGISLSAVEKHLQRAYRLIASIREKLDAGIRP